LIYQILRDIRTDYQTISVSPLGADEPIMPERAVVFSK